jgi:hypothetical protein
MPKKDLGSFWELIDDLYRETSRIVFWCIIAGGLTGAFAAGYWLVHFYAMAPQEAANPRGWQYVLIVVPAAIVGGIVGCFFGVAIEWLIGLIRGPQAAEKKGKRKQWKAHRVPTPKPDEPHPTGFRHPPGKSGKRDDQYSS